MLLDDTLEMRAREFATLKHWEIDHRRKYNGVMYITHPEEVVSIVKSIKGHTQEMIAAAWLHDVVEDCGVTIQEIRDRFGYIVYEYVYFLTDKSKPSDGNRAVRKAIDREHISKAPVQVKTIKIADIISNTSSIVKYDPDFAKVYIREKRLLMEYLIDGDRQLFNRLIRIMFKACKELWGKDLGEIVCN